jgi:hypothetical protein
MVDGEGWWCHDNDRRLTQSLNRNGMVRGQKHNFYKFETLVNKKYIYLNRSQKKRKSSPNKLKSCPNK